MKISRWIAAGCVGLLATASALAQTYPSRAVRIVVP